MTDTEIETTLIISSDDPEALARRIASLTSITNYQLLPHPLALLRDLYLDTPDGFLGARGLALRLREFGPERRITLKGASRSTGWGKERMEIESPWSSQAWRSALRQAGLKPPDPNLDFASARILEVVTASGLEVIQERENDRKVRSVVRPGEADELAELAIDSVTYRFGRRQVRLHEIEIESKAGDGEALLQPIAEALLARYSPALRRWGHGKLSTGMAIEAMLKSGALEELMDTAGNLRPEAFDVIHEYLQRGFV